MGKNVDLDISGMRLSSELRLGCVGLSCADELSFDSGLFFVSASEAVLALERFGPRGKSNSVVIRAFAWPFGKKKFQEWIAEYGDRRAKRPRLPEGVHYDDRTTSLAGVPSSWIRENWARSGRDFVEVYRSPTQAVIVRLKVESGEVLRDPLFVAMRKNLRVIESEWVRRRPVVESPETSPTEVLAVDAEPLPAEMAKEFRAAASRARDELGLTGVDSPNEIAEAIHVGIRKLRRRKLFDDETSRIAFEHGALWGTALCKAAKWKWNVVTTGDDSVFAVCSPNGACAVDPIQLIRDGLRTNSGADASLLTFNLIASKNLPPAPPKSYTWLS